MDEDSFYCTFLYLTFLCVDVGIGGVLLDELTARLNIVTHEHGEYLVGLGGILDGHLLQQTVLRVHGGLPELLRVHLTQTFVTLGVKGLIVAVACHILVDEGLALLLSIAVLRHLLIGALVEWRRGYVEVSTLDHLRHEAVEECHNERVDVRAIDVGVGHDDDLVVAKLVDVGLLRVLAVTHRNARQCSG